MSVVSHDRRMSRRGGPTKVEAWLYEAGVDEVCPITQEAIAESGRVLYEGAAELESYVPVCPGLNAVRLGCGHAFSAVHLMYHWVRSRCVKCPVCRQGLDGVHLRQNGVPAHWRRVLFRRAAAERKKDRAEALADDEREAERVERAEHDGGPGARGFVLDLVEAMDRGGFNRSVHPWCMARLGSCCIELRVEDETIGVFRELTSTMFVDRIVFLVEVDLEYKPFRMLGGVDTMRFPSSRALGVAETGLVNLSYPMSATQYAVEVADGRVKQLNFEVMLDLFCVLALEQEQLRVLDMFAGSI